MWHKAEVQTEIHKYKTPLNKQNYLHSSLDLGNYINQVCGLYEIKRTRNSTFKLGILLDTVHATKMKRQT